MPNMALTPMAVLLLPIVVFDPAPKPTEVLLIAVVREQAALCPMAVFQHPLVREHRALTPEAALQRPVVKDLTALRPTDDIVAVLHPGKVPATVGVAADPPPAVAHLSPETHVESAVRT
jgi:hypothetical protein